MTPRVIMFHVQLKQESERRRQSDALMIATLAAHAPKEATEQAKELAG